MSSARNCLQIGRAVLVPGTDLELGKKSLAKEVSEGRASNSIPSLETVLLASQGTGL